MWRLRAAFRRRLEGPPEREETHKIHEDEKLSRLQYIILKIPWV